MGTYTELTVAGYPLVLTKSEVLAEVMTIFRESDRRVFVRRFSERNQLVWGRPEVGDDQRTETVVDYCCETRKVIDRLEVMGFSLRRVRQDFETGRQIELERLREWIPDASSTWATEEWEFMKELTFDRYANALTTVISKSLRTVPFDDYKQEGIGPVVKYILGHNDDYEFGFFGDDPRLLLRLACELVSPDSNVVQDITALVDAGYYDIDEPVCQRATRSLIAGHPENAPGIILTEGATDGAILKDALAILYPHLAEYYSFLDFESFKSPGGAGQLVSIVKAFAGAGITNRIVALFDNDTAAREATRTLVSVALPTNIAIRHYPELDFLRNYPTLGPSGLTSANVNGLAASIELYLGEDVLRYGEGGMAPIQWRGYNEALRQYQGEVVRKNMLHEVFRQKVAHCRANPSALKTTDWLGLSAILEMVFHAFDDA